MLVFSSHKDAARKLPMAASQGMRLLVSQHDLRDTRIANAPAAIEPLLPGQVRLRIVSFALTANNITYAAFGRSMRYWDFFPADDVGWGSLPAWGFAEVTDSRSEEVPVGQRLYGYLPAASHVVMQPEPVTEGGWVDGSPHRRDLPPVYNQLLRCSADPLHHPQQEAQQALLRPLFVTSFLIDDFIHEHQAFSARRVVLSSASSKTAYGTAFCLAQRRGTPSALEVVGLSSRRHLEFAASLGCYDQTLPYDQLAELDCETATLYVDFTGDAELRRTVHAHWGERLVYSCAVGGTHWEQLGSGQGLAGPRPILFFAPAQVKKRAMPPPDGWGQEGLQLRLGQAWSAFMKPLMNRESPWLRVVREQGAEAVRRRYLELVEGNTDPREGHLLSF